MTPIWGLVGRGLERCQLDAHAFDGSLCLEGGLYLTVLIVAAVYDGVLSRHVVWGVVVGRYLWTFAVHCLTGQHVLCVVSHCELALIHCHVLQLLIVQGAEETHSFVLLHSFFIVIIGIIHLKEPSTCSLLVLHDLLLGMGAHGLMHLDVAGDAQQLAVVRVVCQSLHLLHRLSLFDRLDMMHVNAWSIDAFLKAQLAQAVGTSEYLGSQQFPSLVVQ